MGMREYLNKELFLQSMGLVGDETKYGNKDKDHQTRSYSTWMGYEIMGSVDDSIVEEEDIVEVVRCKDCKFYDTILCFMNDIYNCSDDDFCSYGERKDNDI